MKWVCTVCGYVHEGAEAPAECPVCHVPAEKFMAQAEGKTEWADQHVVGVAQGVDEEIIKDLEENDGKNIKRETISIKKYEAKNLFEKKAYNMNHEEKFFEQSAIQ